MSENSDISRVAVIRLGSLGDFVQAMGPCKSIRHHHPSAHITLITTPPFAEFGQASGYFDDVWANGRAPWPSASMWRFLSDLRGGRFDFVYDLQTSNRTSWYYQLLWPRRPNWSGVAAGCSHPHNNPNRIPMHTVDRQAEQLRIAGLTEILPTDLSWVEADTTQFDLPERYALLVPGGSPHRPAKRWPTDKYAALASLLTDAGITPVLLGAGAERDQLEAIAQDTPAARNLCGRTDFQQIVCLGRNAQAAIGNDTGPMHLLAASGAPSLVLFSHDSDPDRCAPRAERVRTLRRPTLEALELDDVAHELKQMGMFGHDRFS